MNWQDIDVKCFSLFAGPVRVESNDTRDEYLVPCPNICPVFRQINHSAMIHGSDIAEFNEDRTLLEETLGKGYSIKRYVGG